MWAVWNFLIDYLEKWNEASMIYFNYEFYLTNVYRLSFQHITNMKMISGLVR